MALKTRAQLLTAAGVIKNETAQLANTRTRVGGHLEDIIASVLRWEDEITPTQLTADANDYAPTGYATARVYRVTSDSTLRAITGFAGGAAGAVIVVRNMNAAGGLPIYLPANNAGSAAANRLSYSALVHAQSQVMLVYDTTTSLWVPLGQGQAAPSFYWFVTSAIGAAATRYVPPLGGAPQSVETKCQMPVGRAFIARWLSFCCDTALATDTVAATVRRAVGSGGTPGDTAITMTIPAGTAPGATVIDSAHEQVFLPGDLVSIKIVQSGTATQSTWDGRFWVGG